MNSGVYVIRNTATGKAYVGSSVDLQRRRRTHFRQLRDGAHKCIKLQRSWDKHGEDNFVFEVLETTSKDEQTLRAAEQRWIDQLDACRKGYNINPVAGNVGRLPKSEEHRKKIGAGRRGKKHTPETKASLSALAKARDNTLTPERQAKMRAARKTAVWSAESRAALSAKRTGVSYGPCTEERKAAIAAAKRGKPLSEHHKQRIREGLSARKEHSHAD